jgi:hypothetical protein
MLAATKESDTDVPACLDARFSQREVQMKQRVFGSMMAMAAVLAVVSLVPIPAAGQAPTTGHWNAPRLPDGQPDMQGVWIADAVGAAHSVEDGREEASDIIQGRVGERNPVLIVEPSDGRIPYRPGLAARRKELLEGIFTPTKMEHIDTHVRNLLDGVPRNIYVPGGFQIGQAPGVVVILYESNHAYRTIPMDGRPHVGENIKLWMGDSRGRWEGNTLVVDVTNFNEGTWFDAHATFHSDALHVIERFSMVSADRIDYTVTIEDPKVFTSPWKMAITINRNKEKGYEIWEDAKHEGDRDVENILLTGRLEKEAGRTGIHEHHRPR